MRRRKLFTLAAGASAVLCVGVCVLWVRSYGASEELTIELRTPKQLKMDYFSAHSDGGRIEFSRNWVIYPDRVELDVAVGRNQAEITNNPNCWGPFFFGNPGHGVVCDKAVLGFGMVRFSDDPAIGTDYVVTPYWLYGTLAAMVPLAWLWARRRRSGRARHN